MLYTKPKQMRTILLIFILSISLNSYSQLREGFDADEARSLIALCNSYTFIKVFGSDTSIIPKDYHKVYTSEVIGLDNMFQVYEKGNIGVINFRGSTTRASSWVANVYSAMIANEGVIKIDNIDRPYKFANDTSAAVHSGYALAVVLLSPTLIEQIHKLNSKGIYNIIITGHSQGGALANLSRAYFENLPEDKISSKNIFKTYAFANPMCGNENFAKEYSTRYCENNMSYSIINPADLVPKMPMHYQEEGDLFSTTRLKNWAFGLESVDASNLKDYTLKFLEPILKSYIKSSNKWIESLITASYVSIEMPKYLDDINYFQTGSIRKLQPFPNPKIPVDTTGMTVKEIAKLTKAEDGTFYDEETLLFQHKPYHYYIAILKEYFSKDYKELELMYLPVVED